MIASEPPDLDEQRARLLAAVDEIEREANETHAFGCASFDPCYEPPFQDPDYSRCDCRQVAALRACQAYRHIADAWPDPMGLWSAAEAAAARKMKRMIVRQLADGLARTAAAHAGTGEPLGPYGGWVDELAHFLDDNRWLASRGRRNGHITAQRDIFEQLANAGEHIHQVSAGGVVCANGDDSCPVWRSQQ